MLLPKLHGAGLLRRRERGGKLQDLLGQVHTDDRDFLHSQILLILMGSQRHKCRHEGLPNPSSTSMPDHMENANIILFCVALLCILHRLANIFRVAED